MRVSLLVGASVLAFATVASAQSAALKPTPPLTLKFTNVTLGNALEAVGRQSGVTIRVSDTVPVGVLNRELPASFAFNDAPVGSAIEFLTQQSGLTFVVVNANTVIVQAKPR